MKSKELLQVTPEVCQGRDPQIWEMHWITAHAGLAFTFLSCLLTTAMEYVARATQKMPIYKESGSQTPLHCGCAEFHHWVGQSPWLLSPLLTREFVRMPA